MLLLRVLADPDTWQAALRIATPLLLAALGGVLSERAGVVNIALEGMMLTGAFFAVYFATTWHNALLAVIGAMLAAGVMALLHGIASIRFRADQVVSGVAINLLALGLTGFLFRSFFGDNGTTVHNRIPNLSLPGIEAIPFVGTVIGHQNIVVYIALLLLVALHLFLFKTKWGLHVRAVGEHPQAADTAGLNVLQIRYLAVVGSGLLAGLAGAYLSIGLLDSFSPNMTAGRGFIALAAVIFGKWTPFGAFAATLLFGFGDALQVRLQSSGLPVQLLQTLPYLLTVIALAGFVGRATAPAADGVPYVPGE